jgi:hypothetical protein
MPIDWNRFKGTNGALGNLWGDSQQLPTGGVMGEPDRTPMQDSRLAFAAQMLQGGGGTSGNFSEIMGKALMASREARLQTQQFQARQKALEQEGQQRQQQIDQQARGGLVVGQGPDGKPVYRREADMEGKSPFQQQSLPDLPDGMTYDESGHPMWIPEYLAGKTQLAEAGRAPGVVVNTGGPQLPVPPQGMYRPTPGSPGLEREPGFPEAQPNEAQMKQKIGIDNLGVAVDEYIKVLPTFSAVDMLNPNERARVGMVYNNMMLQAKEAYNLGVLNGPDFSILQKVVTNPMTLTGAVTSNKAMENQATELKRIMSKMSGNVTAYAEQKNGAQKPPQQGTDFASEADAIASGVKGEVTIGGRRARID